jgi:hypothetical protein
MYWKEENYQTVPFSSRPKSIGLVPFPWKIYTFFGLFMVNPSIIFCFMANLRAMDFP